VSGDLVEEDVHEGEAVVLAVHDPAWGELYAREAAIIRPRLAPFALRGLEHVGSTAIPRIAAKPIVDIVAGVDDLHALPRYDRRFWIDAGYRWRGEQKPEWLYFVKRRPNGERLSQLHVVPYGGSFWRNIVAFRDALRADRELAQEYQQLKTHLAARFRDERLGYRDAKSAFVMRVLGA
jgi:GrpB-like predicted nucleotidyltransferase (UPF0157 family)